MVPHPTVFQRADFDFLLGAGGRVPGDSREVSLTLKVSNHYEPNDSISHEHQKSSRLPISRTRLCVCARKQNCWQCRIFPTLHFPQPHSHRSLNLGWRISDVLARAIECFLGIIFGALQFPHILNGILWSEPTSTTLPIALQPRPNGCF